MRTRQTRSFRYPALRAAAWIVLTGGVLTAVCGCFFEPRGVEPPTSGASISYLPRTSPANVWENLQIALENNDAAGWEENISEDFTYFADSDAADQFLSLLGPDAPPWTYQQESNFIRGLLDSGVKIDALLKNPEFEVPEATGTVVTWENIIYYVKVVTTADQSESRYRATAIIDFHLEGNFWYIYSWRDQQRESDPDNETQLLSSMGVLRGSFGSK